MHSKSEPPAGSAGEIRRLRAAALALLKRSRICLLSTFAEDGSIRTRAMLNLKHRGLKRVWFSTNTSSAKVTQIRRDSRVTLYYVDENTFEGLRLSGRAEIRQDAASRRLLWSEGAEVYYPLGINDPDYAVVSFTAVEANYYHGLKNTTFQVT